MQRGWEAMRRVGDTIELARQAAVLGDDGDRQRRDLTIVASGPKTTMRARRCGIWLYAVDKGGANTGFERWARSRLSGRPPTRRCAVGQLAFSRHEDGADSRMLGPGWTRRHRNTYCAEHGVRFRGISLCAMRRPTSCICATANTVWTGGHTPGTAGAVLENSCRVDCAASWSVTGTTCASTGASSQSPMVGKTLKAWM